jgi:hypothetical protein
MVRMEVIFAQLNYLANKIKLVPRSWDPFCKSNLAVFWVDMGQIFYFSSFGSRSSQSGASLLVLYTLQVSTFVVLFSEHLLWTFLFSSTTAQPKLINYWSPNSRFYTWCGVVLHTHVQKRILGWSAVFLWIAAGFRTAW